MGGRVVEGTGLENRKTRKRFEGSNPSPSSIFASASRWRRLLLIPLDVCVERRPARRARSPDGHLRFADLGIVERARAHANYVQSRFALRKHRRAACRAELPMHEVAARGAVGMVRQSAFDLHGLAREEDVHRARTRPDILAVATPAMARHEPLSLDPVAYSAAAAP